MHLILTYHLVLLGVIFLLTTTHWVGKALRWQRRRALKIGIPKHRDELTSTFVVASRLQRIRHSTTEDIGEQTPLLKHDHSFPSHFPGGRFSPCARQFSLINLVRFLAQIKSYHRMGPRRHFWLSLLLIYSIHYIVSTLQSLSCSCWQIDSVSFSLPNFLLYTFAAKNNHSSF